MKVLTVTEVKYVSGAGSVTGLTKPVQDGAPQADSYAAIGGQIGKDIGLAIEAGLGVAGDLTKTISNIFRDVLPPIIGTAGSTVSPIISIGASVGSTVFGKVVGGVIRGVVTIVNPIK
ncbi:hypothetical protein HGT70_14615 [Rosenbergiella collisarenosi]|uniref:hypothetical protein n=1 Tax=Rosenbergiella collisarenosi TaxID=1544695 RepID=UPI001BD94189|nr:hypothetical protein [Rosenbergiella collisarenosi]MBT0722503.1 hypothetical protein [Rosenbergiella collisarenosi]